MFTPMPAVVFTLVCFAAHAGADEHTLNLGGLRQIRARVQTSETAYQVQVQMLAVRCFDAATNREVNQSMARAYALQALARLLAKKPTAELIVSGAQIVRSGPAGKDFALTLRIPRDGVQVLQGRFDHNKEKVERARVEPSLFGRKEQYQQTIAELERVLQRELSDLQRAAADKTIERPPLKEQAASLCRKVDANRDRLAEEINADAELFSIGSDLDPTRKSEKSQLLESLKASCDRAFRELASLQKQLTSAEDPK